jgi:hypothetical protein
MRKNDLKIGETYSVPPLTMRLLALVNDEQEVLLEPMDDVTRKKMPLYTIEDQLNDPEKKEGCFRVSTLAFVAGLNIAEKNNRGRN